MASDGRPLLHDHGAGDTPDLSTVPDFRDTSTSTPYAQSQLSHFSNNPVETGPPQASWSSRGKTAHVEEHSTEDEAHDTVNELPGRPLRGSTPRSSFRGLGISPEQQEPEGYSAGRKARKVTIQSIPRVPVPGAFKSPLSTPGLKTPGSGDPLVGSPGKFPQASGYNPVDNTAYDSAGLSYNPATPPTGGASFEGGRYASRQGASPEPSPDPGYFQYDNPQAQEERYRNRPRSETFSIRSTKSAYDTDFQPHIDCRTQESFFLGRGHWLSVTIIVLSIYSTIFSGIFVVIALKGFRYGRAISTHGRLSYSTASILTALFAKTIELSFTTVFVAFLGQVLSRRAFMKRGKGVTLAEMNMRNWIMQPGTMITHYETIQYAALSVLGLISLTAALVGMFYTTAADALVQPQLKFGLWEGIYMQSYVSSKFANVNHLAGKCATPVNFDPQYGGSTCLQIEHASQGYHNYEKYITEWSRHVDSGRGITDQKQRPPGFALLNENITVTAEWINVINMEETSKRFGGRIINNVSLAMPHSGVWKAAIDPRNGIVQPEELDGLGIYNIKASVPSPVLHVLCANMDRRELAPIIYTEWPEARRRPFNTSTLADWPSKYNFARLNNHSITTAVDDLFRWGPKYGASAFPPVFARYPSEFNTLLNHTFTYGRDSIYLLGLPGASQSKNYTLCQMKVSQTPNCSTEYTAKGAGQAASGGGHLETRCEDPTDKLAYIKSVWNATESIGMQADTDWPNIASEALGSLSLNAGISDGNASNSRLLTQYFLNSPALNPSLPSPAEALAVMGGCTLLMSNVDSPFVMFWNYTMPILDAPQTQWFNATIRAQQYASGGVYEYQYSFHVVLLLVFLTNLFILGYFIVHKGLVTDFSEPPNLFSLAVNSPPSHHLAGSCGAGPQGKQYQVGWRVNAEGDHLFMESKGFPEEQTQEVRKSWKDTVKQRITHKGNHGEDEEVELVEGNAQIGRIYDKLSKRQSLL